MKVETGCEECHAKFLAFKHSKRRFCGLQCAYRNRTASKPMFPCCSCGILFITTENRRKYCSPICGRKGRGKKLRDGHVEPAAVQHARWISLGRGMFVLVDGSDFDALNKFVWTLQDIKDGPVRMVREGERQHRVSMHRSIMGTTDPNIEIDHRNGDTLDNRRHNLREATRIQNSGNTHKKSTGRTSRFKGVWWGANISRWQASIGGRVGNRRRFLGCFQNEEDAARAYDCAAREVYDNFACVNFPNDGERSAI